MVIRLQQFVRTGNFGPIKLGISRVQIEEFLGAPDAWTAQDGKANASVWKYGDVEFYFQNHSLWMIFMDDFKVPKGGAKIELDAWIISGQLSCSKAEKHLELAAISYRKEAFPHSENGVHLIANSGVRLAFCGENPANPLLYALFIEAI